MDNTDYLEPIKCLRFNLSQAAVLACAIDNWQWQTQAALTNPKCQLQDGKSDLVKLLNSG